MPADVEMRHSTHYKYRGLYTDLDGLGQALQSGVKDLDAIFHLYESHLGVGFEAVDISGDSLLLRERRIVLPLDRGLQLGQALSPVVDPRLDGVDACIYVAFQIAERQLNAVQFLIY